MESLNYVLKKDEKIVFSVKNVKYSSIFADDVLNVTNKGIFIEKYGMFNNPKGYSYFDYSIINNFAILSSGTSEKKLMLYTNHSVESIFLSSVSKRTLEVLELAINDQKSPEGEYFDKAFYKKLLKPSIKSIETILPKVNPNNEYENKKIDQKFINDSSKIILDNIKIKNKLTNKLLNNGVKFLTAKAIQTENIEIEKKVKPRTKKIKYTFEEQVQIEKEKVFKEKKLLNHQNNSNEVGFNNQQSDINSMETEQKLYKDETKKNEQIAKLKELKDEGILSAEEFNNKLSLVEKDLLDNKNIQDKEEKDVLVEKKEENKLYEIQKDSLINENQEEKIIDLLINQYIEMLTDGRIEQIEENEIIEFNVNNEKYVKSRFFLKYQNEIERKIENKININQKYITAYDKINDFYERRHKLKSDNSGSGLSAELFLLDLLIGCSSTLGFLESINLGIIILSIIPLSNAFFIIKGKLHKGSIKQQKEELKMIIKNKINNIHFQGVSIRDFIFLFFNTFMMVFSIIILEYILTYIFIYIYSFLAVDIFIASLLLKKRK